LSVCAILNSNTFYFFYLSYSDAYHCGTELILAFPCDLSSLDAAVGAKLRRANADLMKEMKANRVRRKIEYRGTGLIEYDEFYRRLSKREIDALDAALARHFGFPEQELDHVINYDIKYRMGQDEAEDGE